MKEQVKTHHTKKRSCRYLVCGPRYTEKCVLQILLYRPQVPSVERRRQHTVYHMMNTGYLGKRPTKFNISVSF